MMDRLTARYGDQWVPKAFLDDAGGCSCCTETCEMHQGDCGACAIQHCIDQLAAYENAAGQGCALEYAAQGGFMPAS